MTEFLLPVLLVGILQFRSAFRAGMGEWKLLAGLGCLIEFGLGLEITSLAMQAGHDLHERIFEGAAVGFLFGDFIGAVLGTCAGNSGDGKT